MRFPFLLMFLLTVIRPLLCMLFFVFFKYFQCRFYDRRYSYFFLCDDGLLFRCNRVSVAVVLSVTDSLITPVSQICFSESKCTLLNVRKNFKSRRSTQIQIQVRSLGNGQRGPIKEPHSLVGSLHYNKIPSSKEIKIL